MLLYCFEEEGLGQYSYAIGCKKKGQIAIIDPSQDIEAYLKYAVENDLIISHIFETHIHSDYASGARELALRARARLFLSGYDRKEKYEVSFPHKKMYENDFFQIGSIELKVFHTPGHTPEHISFLIYDLEVSREKPYGIFSGDVFQVGGMTDFSDPEERNPKSAKLFYLFVQRTLKNFSDELKIFPVHRFSSCHDLKMKNFLFSTLGHERKVNPFLNISLNEENFLSKFLGRKIHFPSYYIWMKASNASGEWIQHPCPTALDIHTFKKHLDFGATLIDLREACFFGKGHVPSSICIGASVKVGFWASRFVSYKKPLLLLTRHPIQIERVLRFLVHVGFNNVLGYLKGGFLHWKKRNFPIETLPELTAFQVKEMIDHRDPIKLIDVRTEIEWDCAHIKDSIHISCFDIPDHPMKISNEKFIFICSGGYRSILAASFYKQLGFPFVYHVKGGIRSWRMENLPVISL